MSDKARRIILSSFLFAFAFSARGIDPGKASGTLRINDRPVTVTYAWAKRQEDGKINILLSDKLIPTSSLSPFNIYKLKEKKENVIVEINIDPGNDTFSVHHAGAFLPSNLSDGKMTLNLTRSTETEIEGQVSAPVGTDVMGDTVSGKVSFRAAVGKENFGRNPISEKEMAGRLAKLRDETASGSFKVDGKVLPLKHAYAWRERDSFDRKKMNTVVMLTDRPVAEESVMKKEMGEAKGLIVKIDAEESEPTHISMTHPGLDQGFQVSGSGGIVGSFDSVVNAPDKIEGRLSTPVDQDLFNQHTYDYSAEFRAKVRTIEDPSDFFIDATSGQKLPKGGGEPGKTFLAFDKAVRSGKLEQMAKFKGKNAEMPDLSTLSAEDKEMIKKLIELQQLMRPKSVKVTDGYISGDRATLWVEGPSANEKGVTDYGSISMAKEEGQWLIVKESWSNKPEPKE